MAKSCGWHVTDTTAISPSLFSGQPSSDSWILTAEEIVNTRTCQGNDACCPTKLWYWFCLHLSKEHTSASQPAKKHDGWAQTLLLTLLMLQFVVLIQIKSRGFEKRHWHLLTTMLFPPVPHLLLTPLPLFIAWNKKKTKIFSNKAATFKVYNHTHSMQLLCKFWIHPSKTIIASLWPLLLIQRSLDQWISEIHHVS